MTTTDKTGCFLYDIRCDDCKKKIGKTSLMAHSVEGGLCDDCKKKIESLRKQTKGEG